MSIDKYLPKKIIWFLAILGLFLLIAFTVFITETPWSLLGLLFINIINRIFDKFETSCPKCNHEFTAVPKCYDDQW